MSLRKWAALAAAAGAMLAPPAMAQTTLRMVSHADIKILDPIWTTALITRNFGYMIYDVLFAKDANLKIQPQMAEKYEISPDNLTYTITLRDGLEWSDGTPVTSADCIASIKRWGARDGLGQLMLKATGELKEIDSKTFAIVLKEPFGLVLDMLGKVSSNVPFMMPKKVAETDPNKQ
ncbi:MAG TPA: ABC transporter substrate-binding protein, partial [Reyranella sp.]|nr:ABC transporter substrate-binding protein [Reyranella sp.]